MYCRPDVDKKIQKTATGTVMKVFLGTVYEREQKLPGARRERGVK